MRLDLFDLQLILNIVDTGSLTKGAERSAISLQACSERIKKLEQRYAAPLFTRHASGVKLTLAGQTMAEHAQLMLQQGRKMEQAMAPFAAAESMPIILWCNSSAQSEYLPLLLPQYLLQNPNTQIELKEAESNDIVAAVKQGTAHLGLISSFFKSDQLPVLDFAHDPLVLIFPQGHALAAHQDLKLADSLIHPFIGLMQHHSLQQSIENQARLLGCEIQYRLRLPNFAAIAQVIANGVGIAVMPKRAALRLQRLYAFDWRPLQGKWANRKLLLTARSFDELPAAYRHFSQFLMQQHPELALKQ